MSNILTFPVRPGDNWQGWADAEWLHTVGFGSLDDRPDGLFDSEPGTPRAELPCLSCEGWREVGQVVALEDGTTIERGPFFLCEPCSGTGAGFEIGGSG